MKWEISELGCRTPTISALDEAEIKSEIATFWKLFASDVLAEISSDSWNYLLIDIRCVDGTMGLYPQDLNRPPFQVPWASILFHKLGLDIEALTEERFELEADKINLRYARLMIDGARQVDLARLAGRSQGVLLRFVSYAEDKPPPFLEERIMPV